MLWVCVCVLVPAVSTGHSQFPLPTYLVLFLNLLQQALSALAPAAGAWEHFQLIRPFSIAALWFSPACLLHFVPYVWANLPFPLQIIPLWTTGISTHIFLYAPQ